MKKRIEYCPHWHQYMPCVGTCAICKAFAEHQKIENIKGDFKLGVQ